MPPNQELSLKLEALQNLLVARATGGGGDDAEYRRLRSDLLNDARLKAKLPRFLHTCRDLFQFWQFIKYEYSHYAERREFLWNEFRPALAGVYCEGPEQKYK
jgi:hypothetical protein